MWFFILLVVALAIESLYKKHKEIQKIDIDWELYDSLINQVVLWARPGDNFLIYQIESTYVTSNGSTSLYVMLTFDTFSDEEMKNPPSIYKSTTVGNEIEKFLSSYHNIGTSQWLSIPFAYGLTPKNKHYAYRQIRSYNTEHFPNVNIRM